MLRDVYRLIGPTLLKVGVASLYVSLFCLFKLSCPFLFLTGIPCPFCGTLRAVRAAIGLQWAEAFGYNPLFFLVIGVFVIDILQDFMPSKVKSVGVPCIALILFVNWLLLLLRMQFIC